MKDISRRQWLATVSSTVGGFAAIAGCLGNDGAAPAQPTTTDAKTKARTKTQTATQPSQTTVQTRTETPEPTTTETEPTQPVTTGWPQYLGTSGRTRAVTGRSAPTSNFSVKWRLGKQTVGIPVADETAVYVMTEKIDGSNPELKAIDREDGSIRWQRSIDTDTTAEGYEPAVVDGTVYLGHYNWTRAFDVKTGKQLWTSPHGGDGLVVSDGLLFQYHQKEDEAVGKILILDSTDGSVVWDGVAVSGEDTTSFHAVVGETVYVGTETHDDPATIVALNGRTGKRQWKTELTARYARLTASKSGVIVRGDLTLHSLDPDTGKKRWKKEGGPLEIPEAGNIGPAVIVDDTVYASIDGPLSAFNIVDGTRQWTADEFAAEPRYVGGRLYNMTGDSIEVIDANSGSKLSTNEVPVEGHLDDIFTPLDDIILVGLYKYYESDNNMTEVGEPLVALSGTQE